MNFGIYIAPAISFFAGAAALIIGSRAYNADKNNIINKVFFALTWAIAFWIFAVIARFTFFDAPQVYFIILSARATFALATLIGMLLFYFTYYFPVQNKNYRPPLQLIKYTGILIVAAALATPWVVISIKVIEKVQYDSYGAFYYLFNIYFVIMLILSVYNFTSKRKDLNDIEKKQVRFVLAGFTISTILAFSTNVIIPLFSGITEIAVVGPSLVIFFVMLTGYAIMKYKFLSVKAIATEILIFTIWAVLFIRTLVSTAFDDVIFNAVVLAFMIVLGIWLIRSVLNEVKAREEVQKLAEELEYANKELKRLDQAKSEFISIASHQLRTPLSIVKGYISMIREGSYGVVPETMKKTLNKIYLSNERLIKLVADLLDLSRMESGKMKYEFANFNFIELVDSIVDEFKIPASDKGLDLRWTAPVESITVWGDSWKLRQVIFNLIDNSLKYTEKGWIEVGIKPDKDIITLTVKDSGIGMSADTAHALFQKFSRGHDSSKVNAQGLGLGLFIAKKIMDDHRGRLWPESDGEGKGSTFFFQMPIKPPPPSPSSTFDSFIKSM